MKKILMLILGGFLLVGCSSTGYSIQVSDADKVIASGNKVEITKQQYFEKMLEGYGDDTLLNQVMISIADKVINKDDLNKLLDEKIATYSELSDGDIDTYAKELGYPSKDEYINEMLLPTVKQELLRKEYAKEHFDEMMKNYQVASFKKITVEKESAALAIIKEATTMDAFDAKMKENETNSEDAKIVNKNSALDENLKKELGKISEVKTDGVYKSAIKLSDGNYAVIYIYGSDHSNKDEIIDSLINDSEIRIDIESAYLKEHKFTIYDDKMKDSIKKISEKYIF